MVIDITNIRDDIPENLRQIIIANPTILKSVKDERTQEHLDFFEGRSNYIRSRFAYRLIRHIVKEEQHAEAAEFLRDLVFNTKPVKRYDSDTKSRYRLYNPMH